MDGQSISHVKINLKKMILFCLGWISAVMSLFLYPFIFGMVGVVSGIFVTKDNQSRAGIYLVVSSIILMGVGLLFSTKLLDLTKIYILH